MAPGTSSGAATGTKSFRDAFTSVRRHGRQAVGALIAELDSQTPTSGLGHVTGDRSIDHIAIPSSWTVSEPRQLRAEADDGGRLSDHDAYIVEVVA